MRLALTIALLFLAAVPRAQGQGGASDRDPPAGVSPPLPDNHWVVGAVRIVESLGLADEANLAQPGLTRGVAEAMLAEGTRRAAAESSPWAGLLRAWHERALEEFPELRPSPSDGSRAARALGGGSVEAGYRERTGGLAPSTDEGGRRRPPVALADVEGVRLSLSLAGRSGLPVTFLASPEVRSEGFAIPFWELAAGSSALAVTVGRGAVGYGPGHGGGIVFGGAVVDRLQLYTPTPFRLPGPLRLLGAGSFHTFLGPLREERHPGDPYLWGMRAALRPHPRLEIGLNRGIVFGSDSAGYAISPVYLFRTLVGFNADENQLLSADVRFRLPSETVLPLTGYLEWGTDDIAGGYKETPAYLVGLFMPAARALPGLSLGVERAFFHRQCCGHGFWYRHNEFTGNWAVQSAPLGHPLGGHGSELAGYGAIDLYRIGLRLNARASWRDRGADNLYAPDRVGTSLEQRAAAAWRVGRRGEVWGRVYRESADSWDEVGFASGVSLLF